MKRLTFAFVIVLSIFVLGGCDQLLEAFFPYDTDTDKSLSGDADYTVSVAVNYASDLEDYMKYNGGSIMVALIPFSETYDGIALNQSGIDRMQLNQDDFENDDDGRDYLTTVTFTTLYPAIYKVLVWVDQDADQHFIFEYDPYAAYSEPAVFASTTDLYEDWIYLSYVQPQSAGIDMSCNITMASIVFIHDFSYDSYEEPYVEPQINTIIMGDTDTYTIDVQQISDFQFYISTPGYYYINWEDSYEKSGAVSYTGDMSVSAYDSENTFYFQNKDSGYLDPVSIYVSYAQSVTIRVDPMYYNAPGTCRIWITPQ